MFHVVVLCVNLKSSAEILCRSVWIWPSSWCDQRMCGRGIVLYILPVVYLWLSHNAAASACPHCVLLFFYFQVGLAPLKGCRGLRASNSYRQMFNSRGHPHCGNSNVYFVFFPWWLLLILHCEAVHFFYHPMLLISSNPSHSTRKQQQHHHHQVFLISTAANSHKSGKLKVLKDET